MTHRRGIGLAAGGLGLMAAIALAGTIAPGTTGTFKSFEDFKLGTDGRVAFIATLAVGVGGVDAGMIGAFVLLGLPSSAAFPAVLVYRLFAFWLPLVPGIIAFFQLRRTVKRWEEKPGSPPVGNDMAESLPGAITS